jgi:hypothetical protein
MVLKASFAFLSFVSLYLLNLLRAWRKNIAEKKARGLPWIVILVTPYYVTWVLVGPLVLPILGKLPERWMKPWLECVEYLQA